MDRHIDYYTIHSNIKEAVPVKEILVKLSLEKLHNCIDAKESAATKLDVCKQRYDYFKL